MNLGMLQASTIYVTMVFTQLMHVLSRAYRLFKEEGAKAVFSEATKKILHLFNPIYQLTKPEYGSYSIGSVNAEFDMSTRRIGKHDFVDDIKSEEPFLRQILSSINKDDIFYDVGANQGTYTCFVGKVLHSGQVVAFEPVPEVFDILKRNVKRNNVPAELLNVALSNKEGTTQMTLKGQTGHQFSGDLEGTFEANVKQGDKIVSDRNIPLPDICKIDIEGAEYLALDGFRETLSESRCRQIFCEIHTDKIQSVGGSPKEVEKLLRELGFNIQYPGDRRDNYFIKATRHQGTK